MKVLKIARLNAELLKCRQHFIETREKALRENFDILTIFRIVKKLPTLVLRLSEGYKVYRLHWQRIPFSRITITRGQFDFYS